MRNFVLASFLLAACVPDGETPSEPRNLTINWHFKGLDGNATPCPAGFTVLDIRITNQYDGHWQGNRQVPCSTDGTHSEQVFTAGREEVEEGAYWTHGKIHDVKLRLTEPSGQIIAVEAPPVVFESPYDYGRMVTLDQDRTVDLDIYPGGGFGVARWHLISNNTGADLISCAAAGVDKIRFTYFIGYYPGTSTPVVTEWPCDAKDIDFAPDADSTQLGSGRTRTVTPESYFGTFEALRNGVVVGTRGGDGDAIGFDSRPGNAHFITNARITITDR